MTTETLEYVRLGMTELSVSLIAFGTWELGGEWGSFDEEKGIEAIRDARELGVNPSTGPKATASAPPRGCWGGRYATISSNRRDEVVIATKGGLRITDERPRTRREPRMASQWCELEPRTWEGRGVVGDTRVAT